MSVPLVLSHRVGVHVSSSNVIYLNSSNVACTPAAFRHNGTPTMLVVLIHPTQCTD